MFGVTSTRAAKSRMSVFKIAIRSSFIAVLLASLLLGFVSGAIGKDWTFSGKVIDADTGEPIEGAVVVASWIEAWPGIAGEGSRLKDVKETLTDKSGSWSITGPKGQMNDEHPYLSLLLGLHYTREPEFIIFKPGYCSWPEGFSIDACKRRINPRGNGEIRKGGNIELPKLTDRARSTIIRNIPSLGMANGSEKDLPMFKKMVSQEETGIARR
jgi:hypothetical protein